MVVFVAVCVRRRTRRGRKGCLDGETGPNGRTMQGNVDEYADDLEKNLDELGDESKELEDEYDDGENGWDNFLSKKANELNKQVDELDKKQEGFDVSDGFLLVKQPIISLFWRQPMPQQMDSTLDTSSRRDTRVKPDKDKQAEGCGPDEFSILS